VPASPESGQHTTLSAHDALAQVRSVIDQLAGIRLAKTSIPGIFARSQLSLADVRLARKGLGQLDQFLREQSEEQQRLQAIQQVSRAVTSSLDQTKVLNLVMDTIIELTGAERGFLMLLEPDSDELVFRVARNMDRKTIQKYSFEISRSIVNRVAHEGEPIVTTDAQIDPRFSAQDSVVSYNLRSILCVPLKVRAELIGVIYADNRVVSGLFDDKDRDLLMAFANQAAIAIQNARLFEQVTAQLEAITAMRNLMANVFSSIASGVITTDIDDRVTLINRAAETILGVAAEQVEGRPYAECLPELLSPLSALVGRVKSQEVVQSTEVATELSTRGRVTLSLHFSPLKDAQNATLGVAMVIDDLTEKRRREKTMAHVRRYLPPALVDSLPDIEKVQLGGTRQTISVLFADVRGFSTFSESQEPEFVVGVINRFFTVAAEAILLHEGVIDKFMGDAVMALFNTPFLPQADHALRAARAALAMMYDIRALHEQLPPDQHLWVGAGLHTGEAILGNVGSPDRLDFSAIGDAVNLAKRLQEIAGPGQILISQAAYQQIGRRAKVMPLKPVKVKGRQALEQIYELVGLTR
jgi:PAS domain S-box-containing protein